MKKITIMIMLLFGLLMACDRAGENHPCYDSSIDHDGICHTDCPGIKGCDGETYCNECEAARHGIKPK